MRIVKLTLALLLFAAPAFAQVATPINEQGTSGAPVAVSNAAVAVLVGNVSRLHWGIYSETVAIRCTLGTNAGTGASSAGKGNPVPSATVGFYLAPGILYTETSFNLGSATASREIDCFSTGAATNVDTWAE